jgi:hypothetical protein
MRWLALVPYGALVAFVWVNAGAQAGLVVLACALVLTVCFRPMAAGAAIRGSARRLYRSGNAAADFVPAVVRAGGRAVQGLRRRSAEAERPAPPAGDDELVPVLLANGESGAQGIDRTPDILASGDGDPPRS